MNGRPLGFRSDSFTSCAMSSPIKTYFYWGSPALMDPHLSQQLAGLQHPVLQEVTRPKARFKPTWPIRTYRLLPIELTLQHFKLITGEQSK